MRRQRNWRICVLLWRLISSNHPRNPNLLRRKPLLQVRRPLRKPFLMKVFAKL